MSIFTKISSYFTGRRLNRLERDLKMLDNRVKFEPRYSKIAAGIFTSDKFTRKMSEYMVWHTGDVDTIRDFFSNGGHLASNGTADSPDSNLFWETAPNDYRFIHSGIPALISTKKAAILFGKGFTYDVSVLNAEGKEDKAAGAKARETIERALTDSNLEQLCLKAADSASWGGHVFIKLSHDAELSEHPIVESYDIRFGEDVKRRGITMSIPFKSFFTKVENGKTIQYRLEEIYRTINAYDLTRELAKDEIRTVAEIGDACIEYKLYSMKDDGREEEIPYPFEGTLPELEEIEYPFIAFKGVKGINALSVPNRLPNNDFIDCQYGASDYAHSTTAFDSLDEVLSELSRETRDNKSIRKWPNDWLPKTTSGTISGINTYIRNIVQYERDVSENAENKMEVETIEDKTVSLIEKLKQSLSLACNNAGISPLALGITGLESVAAGSESQRERNKVTLETRDMQLQIWGPVMEKLIAKILAYDNYLHSGTVEGFERYSETLDLANIRVSVHFPDYIIASDKENIETWGKGVLDGVVDRKTAIDRIFADLDESKRLEMYTLLSFEQGVSSDNPNALSMQGMLQKQPPEPTK